MNEERICYNCFCERDDSYGCCPNCGYDPEWDSDKYPLALPHGYVLCDKYILGRVLGQGGYGITYLAMDKWLGIKVAVKEYFPETGATRTTSTCHVTSTSAKKEEEYQKGKEDFLQEARVLATFAENPNIVKIHGYFEENNTAYFVMDYIEGISFQRYIKNQGGKIDWKDAYEKLLPIIKALEEVHQKDIIHRDISPDNIYITSDGTMKLLDFGAARLQSLNQSHSLDVVLKHGYAPFEQYNRKGKQGPFTDVYALCACFYAAVTGVLPPDAPERITGGNLESFASLGVEIPSAVEQVILKGLEVLAENRYQNMAELREALEHALIAGTDATTTNPKYSESGVTTQSVQENIMTEEKIQENTVVEETASTSTDTKTPKFLSKEFFSSMNKKQKIIGIGAACVVLVIGVWGIWWLNHDHSYGEWTIVKAPSCTETGVRERNCSCGAVEKEELPVEHKLEIVPAVAATCTETGLTEGSVCSVCGFVETEQTVVDALGHTVVTVPGVEATCTDAGTSEGSQCSVCGVVVTEQVTVDALGHSFSQNICERCVVEKWWAEIWTEKDVYHVREEVKVEMYIYTNEPNAVITPYDAILIGVSGDGTSYKEYIEGESWEGSFGNGKYLSSTWTLADDTGLYAYGLMDEE